MYLNVKTKKLNEIWENFNDLILDLKNQAPKWFLLEYLNLKEEETTNYSINLIYLNFSQNYILNDSEELFKFHFLNKIISNLPSFFPYLNGKNSKPTNQNLEGNFTFKSDTNTNKDNLKSNPKHYASYSFNRFKGKELNELNKWKTAQIEAWISLFSPLFQILYS